MPKAEYLLESGWCFPWIVTAYVMRRTRRTSTVRIIGQKTLEMPHRNCPGLRHIPPGQVGEFRISGTRMRLSEIRANKWVREDKG